MLRKIQHAFTSSLRARVLVFLTLAFVGALAPAYVTFTWIVDSTVAILGTLFAEKQVQFDRYRGLSALVREASLAETLARAPAIMDWARDEADPGKRERGIAELEHFRTAFAGQSYFFVVDASGDYYFNDAENSYAGDQYRYTVERSNPRDGWYFSTAALGSGCHLNVDHDDVLRVTNVWINCVITDEGQVLGILGTGIDLTDFIAEVVQVAQPGVNSMFVDRTGAIQAHRDPAQVDFHSITKAMEDKKTIYAMVDNEADRMALADMLDEVATGEVLVRSRFMGVEGRRMLVGVGYLDQLGWYDVTLMDIDEVIDRRLFLPMGGLLAAMMAIMIVVAGYAFRRVVLDRLERLEAAVAAVQAGQYDIAAPASGRDEIGRLGRAFSRMARTVGEHTHLLERKVRLRTRELEGLAYRDALTGIANRRGFVAAYEQARDAAQIDGGHLGVLLIDIDRFKQINDAHGHLSGDLVVHEAAARIGAALRVTDVCGRWGGDEFIVLLRDCGPGLVEEVAARIMAAIADTPVQAAGGVSIAFTVSVGAYAASPDETVDTAAEMADAALYAAKHAGRNRLVVNLGGQLHPIG